MNTLIKVIGLMVFAIGMYSVPILLTCAFIFDWYGVVKLLLLLSAIAQCGLLANGIDALMIKEDET